MKPQGKSRQYDGVRLLESQLREELHAARDRHAGHVLELRSAEAGLEQLKQTVSGHELALRKKLAESREDVDMQALRLHQDILDRDRGEQAAAELRRSRAESELDGSRDMLLRLLDKRNRLKQIRERRKRLLETEVQRHVAVEADAAWLTSRRDIL